MRISESQLRRVVKRLVKEQSQTPSFKDGKSMLQSQAKQFMDEFQKGDQDDFRPGFPTRIQMLASKMTMGSTLGEYGSRDVEAALVAAGFSPSDAKALKDYMFFKGDTHGLNKFDPWSVVRM